MTQELKVKEDKRKEQLLQDLVALGALHKQPDGTLALTEEGELALRGAKLKLVFDEMIAVCKEVIGQVKPSKAKKRKKKK